MAAAIWGFAFVAQRKGMEHIGPFTFNALRFLVGGLVLVPVLAFKWDDYSSPKQSTSATWTAVRYGAIAGFFIFLGITFQQMGLVVTTATKAAFITGLYVIFVPVIGLLIWKQRIASGTWLGASLALVGMYLLSLQGEWRLASGDALILIGAICWAVHVQVIGLLSPRTAPVRLAMLQFFACSLYSWIIALGWETIDWKSVRLAMIPILYTGILSSAVGFTIQIIVQRKASPSNVAIIMSLETVFAAIGGWLLLDERLSAKQLAGCVFMFAGMVVAQTFKTKRERLNEPAYI